MLLTLCARADEFPERVTFSSADGSTALTGYLFVPPHPVAERVPAVVMMHGRAGAYSTNAKGRYDASTLSRRHMAWGELWAAQGYIALLVDGFGPRGYPQGFPRFSYETRPAELNEVTVRPLDAYGALAYLRARADADPDRIGLQGWSNGGSATLAAMDTHAPGRTGTGFRAALAFYPACGLKGQFENGYLVPRHRRRGSIPASLRRAGGKKQGRRRHHRNSVLSWRVTWLRRPWQQASEQ
jgi:dienelactone hydrolase